MIWLYRKCIRLCPLQYFQVGNGRSQSNRSFFTFCQQSIVDLSFGLQVTLNIQQLSFLCWYCADLRERLLIGGLQTSHNCIERPLNVLCVLENFVAQCFNLFGLLPYHHVLLWSIFQKFVTFLLCLV